MPVTEYKSYDREIIHSDAELQDMLNEINARTGKKFVCETIGDHTALKLDLDYEYQILTCVSTVREAKAYCLGALGVIDRLLPFPENKALN